MKRSRLHFLATVLVATILIAGCSGIEPYNPPDYKETPPGSGMLTGKDGEFVVYSKKEGQETAGEDKEAEK